MGTRLGTGKGSAWVLAHKDYKGAECLTWPFSTSMGYGQLSYEGKLWRAHRLMCTLVHGPAPKPGMQAAHNCGKGHLGCVNPSHIEWKTLQQNAMDRVRHRRVRKPTTFIKLNEEQVMEIRAARGFVRQKDLAKRFGVSTQTIVSIQRRRTWKGRGEGSMFQMAFDAISAEVSRERSPWTSNDVEKLVYRLFDAISEATAFVTQKVPDRLASQISREDMLDIWRSMAIAAKEDR